MQDKVFSPEIWYLSMWGRLKFTYEMPKTTLHQTRLL